MDVVVAPLSCSNISLLSQKLGLQRVRENFVCTERGSLSTSLRLVKTVYEENETVSGSVWVSRRAQSNQRASQHTSRSKHYIYQTFLDYCVHLLPSGKFCMELSRNYGHNLTEETIRLFSPRLRRHKKFSCMIILPLSLFWIAVRYVKSTEPFHLTSCCAAYGVSAIRMNVSVQSHHTYCEGETEGL